MNGLNHNINATQYWLAFDCVAGNIGPNSDNLSAVRYRRFVPHAVRLVHERFQQVGSQQERLQDKLNETGVIAKLLHLQVQYAAGELMYQRALAGNEKALGPDHTSTFNTVHNLGNLYYSQGKLGEAEQMYQRALAGYDKAS
jgi:tetratricopeptide (TPR) repeat protein